MKKMNKLVALLLAAVMVLGMLPATTAHAHEYHTHGVEEYPVLALDTPTTVEITEGGTVAYFTFTPETTHLYHFYSASVDGSWIDTKGYIYDAEMNELAYGDDPEWGNSVGVTGSNFLITKELEAGKTYVLTGQFYGDGAVGSFSVTITAAHDYTSAVTKEHTCTEDGVLTYTCSYCGESYDEPIPAAHTWGEDGICTVCGETYLITGKCGDDLTWSLDWFGKLTISGTGDMYDFFYSWEESTPSEWYTDYNYDIKSVVIEEGCTSIGNYAFYQCNSMAEVTFASTVTEIGEHAFDNTALTSIVVPETVTTLGAGAFASNYNLESATLPSGLMTIPASCFEYCGALTEVVWPAAATSVGAKAFYSCNLGDLVVPEGIAFIGESAFSGNSSMTVLTLPSTLAQLDGRTFSSCWNVTDFIFTGNAPVIPEEAFNWITANVWYPAGNSTWTEDVMQQYGGTLTWKAMCATHAFSEWTTVAATCEVGEYQTRSCNACGWTETTEPGEPLGHDYVYTVIEPNCATYEYGRTEITCTRCDYYSSENWVWPEHQYETTVTAPTCTEDGYTTYTCTVCGSYYTSDYVYATGHVVETWSEPTEATCTEASVKTGTCTVCGETATEEVSPALGHTWGEEGVENEDGSVTYTCTVCGETYRTEGTVLYLGDNTFSVAGSTGSNTKTFVPEATGELTITTSNVVYHNAYAWDNGYTDQYWQTIATDWAFNQGMFTITINGEAVPFTVEGSEVDAKIIMTTTVTAGDTVTITLNHIEEKTYYFSNDIQVNMNLALEVTHTHSYTAVVTEPTCTEGGYTTYTCECGDTYVSDEVAALGHTEEIIPAVAATCTESGLTEGKKCSVCDEILVAQETVAALGHTEEILPAIAATCTEPGLTEGKKCSVCDEILVAQEIVSALGHSWKGTKCQACDATRENPFTDVPEESFYIDAVLWAVEMGITNGTTDTTFSPNGDLLRAQVVTMLWRAAGKPEPTTTENPFTDVNEGHSFYKAVLWAVENEITTGTSATTFTPYGTTNRAQVVTFLWRYMGKPAATATSDFTDVEAGKWYSAAINWAVENSITNGMGDGTFGITTNCNRAHMVTFLYRASQLSETEEPEVQKYLVLLKSDDNGTIKCDVNEAAPGEEVSFTATPNEGYAFTQFKIFDPNGEIDVSTFQLFEGENENEYVFIMIAHDLIVDCVFEPIA